MKKKTSRGPCFDEPSIKLVENYPDSKTINSTDDTENYPSSSTAQPSHVNCQLRESISSSATQPLRSGKNCKRTVRPYQLSENSLVT